MDQRHWCSCTRLLRSNKHREYHAPPYPDSRNTTRTYALTPFSTSSTMPWTSNPQPQPSLYSDTKRYLSRNFGLPIQTLDVVLTITATCSVIYVYRNYLKRIPDTAALPPHFFRKRTLYGRVVSVGDADNFRLYHTPGGKWMGWGWLPGRRVPELRKKLKGQTVGYRCN